MSRIDIFLFYINIIYILYAFFYFYSYLLNFVTLIYSLNFVVVIYLLLLKRDLCMYTLWDFISRVEAEESNNVSRRQNMNSDTGKMMSLLFILFTDRKVA